MFLFFLCNEFLIFTAYSTFCRAQGPVEFESFKNTVILDLEKAEDRLNHSWFPGIINVFADKNTFVGPRADKLDSFYNSVTTLISNQVGCVGIFVLSREGEYGALNLILVYASLFFSLISIIYSFNRDFQVSLTICVWHDQNVCKFKEIVFFQYWTLAIIDDLLMRSTQYHLDCIFYWLTKAKGKEIINGRILHAIVWKFSLLAASLNQTFDKTFNIYACYPLLSVSDYL